MKPPAIGYLRRDISGSAQTWDETQLRSLADRLGYRLTKTVVFSERTDQPVQRLLGVVYTTGAAAVVTPDMSHLGNRLPDDLTAQCEVITVNPETRHPRVQPPLPA